MTTKELKDKLQLNVQTRTVLGNSVRKLRRDKILPAVISSNKFASTNLQTATPEFTRIYKLAGKTHIIELNVEDTKTKINALVTNLDIDPVKGFIRHIDFLAVDLSQKVVVFVPLELVGESDAVKSFGAVLVNSLSEIEIECFPDKIPESIEVDITTLATMDDLIRVGDLPVNPDYIFISEPDQAIVGLATETVEDEVVEEIKVVDADLKTPAKVEPAKTDKK